jgi:hypothetical protein
MHRESGFGEAAARNDLRAIVEIVAAFVADIVVLIRRRLFHYSSRGWASGLFHAAPLNREEPKKRDATEHSRPAEIAALGSCSPNHIFKRPVDDLHDSGQMGSFTPMMASNGLKQIASSYGLVCSNVLRSSSPRHRHQICCMATVAASSPLNTPEATHVSHTYGVRATIPRRCML